jgi:HD superfamily phosphohydrolase
MAQIKQLGGAYLVFPGGTHTRLSHMIGTAHLTAVRTDALVKSGVISANEAHELVITALVHDVGHWSFSHLLEPMCGSHDQRGSEIIRGELAPYIEECGASPEVIEKLHDRQSTLSELIFLNPIGTDKLDYLVRDAHYAYGTGMRYDDLLYSHVRWEREIGMYVLAKGWPLLSQLIPYSWFMYTEVYERVSTRIGQRYIQELLRQMIALDGKVERQLYEGGEDGVMGTIAAWCVDNSEHECAERLRRIHKREYPKKAIIFSPHPEVCPLRYKPTMAVLPCDQRLLETTEGWTVEKMADAELRIAEAIGLKALDVAVAVAPPARRWKAPNVRVQYGKTHPLVSESAPELTAMSQHYAKMSCTVAVAVDKCSRMDVVADHGLHDAIREILTEP